MGRALRQCHCVCVPGVRVSSVLVGTTGGVVSAIRSAFTVVLTSGGGVGTRPWCSFVCLFPTLCGPERVLVVSTEPLDDLSCLTTPGGGGGAVKYVGWMCVCARVHLPKIPSPASNHRKNFDLQQTMKNWNGLIQWLQQPRKQHLVLFCQERCFWWGAGGGGGGMSAQVPAGVGRCHGYLWQLSADILAGFSAPCGPGRGKARPPVRARPRTGTRLADHAPANRPLVLESRNLSQWAAPMRFRIRCFPYDQRRIVCGSPEGHVHERMIGRTKTRKHSSCPFHTARHCGGEGGGRSPRVRGQSPTAVGGQPTAVGG